MSQQNSQGPNFLPGGNESIEQWESRGLSTIDGICCIITMPIESFLRPLYGTRYFRPIIALFSYFLMFCVFPVFGAFAGAVMGFAGKFVGVRPHGGFALIGFGTFTFLYFLATLVHGTRVWWLMIHPEREDDSQHEGPGLPFFRLLPKGNRFWMVRVLVRTSVPADRLGAAVGFSHH